MTESAGSAGSETHGNGPLAREGFLLAMAALLAALAGMVDAIGYQHLSGLFVSFMSGNSTQLAIALGRGNPAEAGRIAELVAFFVLGAAAGQMLADIARGRHMTWVLVGVGILLAISGVLRTAPEPMTFAMGALNASMHRAGHIPVSVTFVTGVLVRLGQGLGSLLIRASTGWDWLVQASPWVGIIAGAAIGGLLYSRIGETVIWVAVGLAGLLAACSMVVPQPEST
jgi:uncharacterized membrane protein YoaK (UPF0700 family)